MVSLTEIQELIFRCVDALSRPMPAARRERLTKGLAALRAAEGDYLASHKDVLCKSSTEGSWEQFERDLAAVKQGRNAAPPKPSPVPTENETVYRAPENMRGLTLHTVAGMLTVPDHGIVHIAARPNGHDDKCDCAKCSMHRDFAGAGFANSTPASLRQRRRLIRSAGCIGSARLGRLRSALSANSAPMQAMTWVTGCITALLRRVFQARSVCPNTMVPVRRRSTPAAPRNSGGNIMENK